MPKTITKREVLYLGDILNSLLKANVAVFGNLCGYYNRCGRNINVRILRKIQGDREYQRKRPVLQMPLSPVSQPLFP